jgi:hypothetical protein
VVSPTVTTSYSVVVSDGYNVTQAGTSVMVDPLPVPDAGSDQVIVYGTTTCLQAGATSGSGNYQFHWEPAYLLDDPDCSQPTTVNLYETTLFTLRVTDLESGCECDQPDEMAVLISGSALSVNPSATPGTICSGEQAELHALAGGGTGLYSYSWSSSPPGFTSDVSDPVVTPLESTVYTVQVSDGYNSVSGSTGITVNPAPFVYLGADTIICVFDTLTINAGNPGSAWIWSNGSTEQSISIGSTGIGYEYKIVTVTVTSPEGCATTAWRAVAFDFTACTGTGDINDSAGIICYPNPGDGLLYIGCNGHKAVVMVTICNTMGKTILDNKELHFTEKTDQHLLDLRSNPPGIYLIRLQVNNSGIYTVKYILDK